MFFQPFIIAGLALVAGFVLLLICAVFGLLFWFRKWRIATVLALTLLGIGGVFLLFQSLPNRHAAAMKKLSPEVKDWSKVDVEFWNWSGDFDWFRTPVRFPYDLHSIDTPSHHGFLNRNIHLGHSSSPNEDGENKVNDIEAFSTDQTSFLFRQSMRDGSPDRWGIFTYFVDTTDYFKDEPTMWAEARRHKFSGPPVLDSIEAHSRQYWGK